MRHAALALIATLALVPVALAQDDKTKPEEKDTSPALPIHPLAGAKEGDWSVFTFTLKGSTPNKKRAAITKLQSWRVVKATDTTIEVAQSIGDGGPETHVTMPAKTAPTIATYFEIKGTKISGVDTSDEKKTVGGREFVCKKVTFDTDDGQQKSHTTAWFDADVKGSGLVALTIEMTAKDEKFTFIFELVGYGSKEKTEFGKTRAELLKELKKDAPSDEPKKDEKK